MAHQYDMLNGLHVKTVSSVEPNAGGGGRGAGACQAPWLLVVTSLKLILIFKIQQITVPHIELLL